MLLLPETPRAAPNSPNPSPSLPLPSSLCFPAAPMMLLSQGLAAQSPSCVPIHHWGFGRQILLLVLQAMQGLAVMKTWAAELSSHCSVGASAAPPALLRSPPGRWEVGQVPVWGAERCWEPWAGQAGAVTRATIGTEWIPLNRAECSEGWGQEGRPLLQGRGRRGTG